MEFTSYWIPAFLLSRQAGAGMTDLSSQKRGYEVEKTEMRFEFKNKFTFYILFTLFLSTIIVWSAVFQNGSASLISSWQREELKVVFFDVGQGSATFIETANKNQVLIDGGPGSQILNKLGESMPFFDRSIDVVILTHPDADHLNGLVDVLKKYDVKEIVEPCIAESSAAYQEWLQLIEEKKIHRTCAQFGQKIKLAQDVELNVLYPFKSLEGASFKNTNDASIVAKLIYGKSEILLTGDTEEKTEYQLINSNIDLKSQILQVGHHGSKSSTSENFIKAVFPETAVIQVGKNNRYGHPHQQTLDRLNSFCHSDPASGRGKNLTDKILKPSGAKALAGRQVQDNNGKSAGKKCAEIFRTDLDGDIEFLCDISNCYKK